VLVFASPHREHSLSRSPGVSERRLADESGHDSLNRRFQAKASKNLSPRKASQWPWQQLATAVPMDPSASARLRQPAALIDRDANFHFDVDEVKNVWRKNRHSPTEREIWSNPTTANRLTVIFISSVIRAGPLAVPSEIDAAIRFSALGVAGYGSPASHGRHAVRSMRDSRAT